MCVVYGKTTHLGASKYAYFPKYSRCKKYCIKDSIFEFRVFIVNKLSNCIYSKQIVSKAGYQRTGFTNEMRMTFPCNLSYSPSTWVTNYFRRDSDVLV